MVRNLTSDQRGEVSSRRAPHRTPAPPPTSIRLFIRRGEKRRQPARAAQPHQARNDTVPALGALERDTLHRLIHPHPPRAQEACAEALVDVQDALDLPFPRVGGVLGPG